MPAVSLLGTDYASLDAWWDAEKDNDYSGAGPILEVPAGLGAMLTANEQFRDGTASKFTIRAVSGDEWDGDNSTDTGKAVLDCGGYELDFRENDMTFEDIKLTNFTFDASDDTHTNLTFTRCLVEGYIMMTQAITQTGVTFEDSQIILPASDPSSQTDRVLYFLNSKTVSIERCTIINLGTGTSYGCIHNRSSATLTLNRNVIYSATNSAYSTSGSTPPTPTAANNCAHDSTFPGSTETGITSSVFEDYASGDYRIVSTSAPATQGSPAGAFIQASGGSSSDAAYYYQANQ